MKTVRTIILGLLFVFLIAWNTKLKCDAVEPKVKIVVQKEIMSIRELQTFLNEQGHSRYTCAIDGKMGKETLRAWSNYINDRYYKESTYK